jgi:hypothetical protein
LLKRTLGAHAVRSRERCNGAGRVNGGARGTSTPSADQELSYAVVSLAQILAEAARHLAVAAGDLLQILTGAAGRLLQILTNTTASSATGLAAASAVTAAPRTAPGMSSASGAGAATKLLVVRVEQGRCRVNTAGPGRIGILVG